jgi:hypothetical protein
MMSTNLLTPNVKPVLDDATAMPKNGLQPGDKLPTKKSRVRNYPPLTKVQQRLVEEHLWVAARLAHSAKSLTGGHTGCFTRDDLESVALLALCVAATRFDPELGWKFSTFAWTTCRGWIQHALRDHSRMVRVPRWINSIRKEVRELALQGLSYTEIAEELGIEENQVAMCEESWQEIYASFDWNPEDSSPRELSYQIDEVKTLLGPEVFKQVGDLTDADIKLLLLHVEGQLETSAERDRAELLLEDLRHLLG